MSARSMFETALAIDQEVGFMKGTSVALIELGALYWSLGKYDQAATAFEQCQAISRDYSLKWEESSASHSLGFVALIQNDYLKAAQHFKDGYSLLLNIDEEWSAVDLLTGLAAVAAGMKQFERAAKLKGAAELILDRLNLRYEPYDRANFDLHIQIARDQLGEAKFETLDAEGRAMTMEQAIEYALENQS